MLGLLNDLHKGRHVGTIWRWFIDFLAVAPTVFVLTGFVFLFQAKRRLRVAMNCTGLGVVTSLVIVLLSVLLLNLRLFTNGQRVRRTTNMWKYLLLLCTLLLSAPSHSVVNDELVAHNVVINEGRYKGRDAIQVVESEGTTAEDKLAIFADSEMRNGSISGYVSGARKENANPQARGFVGLAFRIDDTASSFEAVYLRPTNARADNQLRRNHSIQYFTFPDFPWHHLRRESPAKYESYADMAPGEWIHYRLEVDGDKARLFLNRSEQPALIVNDLKLGDRAGRIGLWVGPGTDAHFSDIKIAVHK